MWRRKRADRWERVDLDTPTATTTARPPEQAWHEVVTLVTALDERDRARDLAVRLEQLSVHAADRLAALRPRLFQEALTADDIVEELFDIEQALR